MLNKIKVLTTASTQANFYKTKTAIWLNKVCKIEGPIAKYIQVKANGNSRQRKNTKKS